MLLQMLLLLLLLLRCLLTTEPIKSSLLEAHGSP
jgi:hypothetical protein